MEKTGAIVIGENDFILKGDQKPRLRPKIHNGHTPYTFIMFYAPWCPHCISKVDNIKHLVNLTKLVNPNVRPIEVAVLNADTYQNIARKVGVSAFPTFGLADQKGEIKLLPLELDMVGIMTDMHEQVNKELGTLYQFATELSQADTD